MRLRNIQGEKSHLVAYLRLCAFCAFCALAWLCLCAFYDFTVNVVMVINIAIHKAFISHDLLLKET